MRREDHGVQARERLDERADLGDLFRVEADGGIVEDQDLGIAEDRLRESDPLPVALRQPADEPVLDVGDEAALHDLRDPAPTLGAPHALDLGDEVQVRRDAEVPVERDALREVADPPADLQRLAEHVVSRDLRRPARGGHEAGEDAHRRRLPRPVRAEEAHDLARRDAERHVPDRGDRAIMLREALYFDHSRLTDGLYTVTGPARSAPLWVACHGHAFMLVTGSAGAGVGGLPSARYSLPTTGMISPSHAGTAIILLVAGS